MDKLTVEDIRELLLPELEQIHKRLDAVEGATKARFELLEENFAELRREIDIQRSSANSELSS